MPNVMPLSRWQLTGKALPARMIPSPDRPSFSLPGAQALADILIGEEDDSGAQTPQREEEPSAPFALPGLLPEDMPGPAVLSRELHFGRLSGDCASLHIDLLLGRGDVCLDGERVASFSSGPFSLDLTQALLAGRSHTLSFRFDGTRPAGMQGGVVLRTARCARILRAALLPDADLKTMTVRVSARGLQTGTYLLRAQPCPPSGAAQETDAREVTLPLSVGETRVAELTLSVPGERFVPGKPYAAPGVRLSLLEARPCFRPARPKRGFFRMGSVSSPASPRMRSGALCDRVLLTGGYPGDAPRFFLPLTARECLLPPEACIGRLQKNHIPAVFLPVPASDALARELTRAGIAALQRTPGDEQERARLAGFPCITLTDAPAREQSVSLEASAWRLSSMVDAPSRLDPGLTPAQTLSELAGRELDPASEETRAVLSWLRAVSVRLRAEAARQGRIGGALCAPGEWANPDIAAALETALSPLHLSALPQRGAWWTLSRFSASICAFLPPKGSPGSPPRDPFKARGASGGALLAEAVLETEDGALLSRLCAPCPRAGGEIGVLETTLPAFPCVLTLTTRLLQDDAVLEQSAIPVYVGERGVLQSAFGKSTVEYSKKNISDR